MLPSTEDQLSLADIVELSTDHLLSDSPVEVAAISFVEEDPASAATPLGTATLATAIEFLNMPLREDAGVNNDKGGHIRTFFLDGLKWSKETWDNWAEKYPKSGVAKPEWCAAFASYCARLAYNAAGLKLPATPSGSASELASRAQNAHRFLTREALVQEDGSLRSDVTPPGPGDLIVWHGHVGLLKNIFPSGAFTSIEGNTWHGSVRKDGVYQLQRNSMEKRADGTFKLVGFVIFASKDGQVAETAQAAQTSEEPAPAGETVPDSASAAQAAPDSASAAQTAPDSSPATQTDPSAAS